MRDTLKVAGTGFLCRSVDLWVSRHPHSDPGPDLLEEEWGSHCRDMKARVSLGVGAPAPFFALTFLGVCRGEGRDWFLRECESGPLGSGRWRVLLSVLTACIIQTPS